MRKKDIRNCIKKYLPSILRLAFTCLLVSLSHLSKADTIAFESFPEITSFKNDLNKVATIVPKKIKDCTIADPQARQARYKKKFQMGGDSNVEFKGQLTILYRLTLYFLDIPINYHTPEVTTAVILFIHRLASF